MSKVSPISPMRQGGACFSKKQYPKALTCFQQALEKRNKEFGPHHHKTANALFCLGRTYARLKKPGEACENYLQALNIIENLTTPSERSVPKEEIIKHLKELRTEEQIIDKQAHSGYAHYERKQFNEAAACFTRILDFFKNPPYLDTAYWHQWCGRALYHAEQFPEAIIHLKKALAIYCKPDITPDTTILIWTWFRLGCAYAKARDSQNAVSTMNDLLGEISKIDSEEFKSIERDAYRIINWGADRAMEERFARATELRKAIYNALIPFIKNKDTN